MECGPRGFCWVNSANGENVAGAVIGGDEPGSGGGLYIGRANHNGDLVPGKVHRKYKLAYIAHG